MLLRYKKKSHNVVIEIYERGHGPSAMLVLWTARKTLTIFQRFRTSRILRCLKRLMVPTPLIGLTSIIMYNFVFTALDVRCSSKTLLDTENEMSFRSSYGGMVCVHSDVHLDHIPSNSSLKGVLPSFITSSLFPSPHCSRPHDPFPNSHGLRLPHVMQTSLILLSLFSLSSFCLWVWRVSSRRIRDNPRIVFAVLS